jgi:nitroreductase
VDSTHGNSLSLTIRSDRDRLSKAKPHGASFLANAPLAVAVCADPERSDVWVEDVSIAPLSCIWPPRTWALGAAGSSCASAITHETLTAGEYAARVLGLRDGLEVSAIMAIGYPAQQPAPHPATSLQHEKVSVNRYGRSE